ncbi:MAG TPA: hypothetical protein VE422_46960 [Terriglobia bacterium]|nr:hypothetical protein [Terriglobia bacterium]
MHHCEEFRERITEHIIDREDLTGYAEFQRELVICQSCADFYAESKDVIEAMSTVAFGVSEERWSAMDHRLRMSLLSASTQESRWNFRMFVPAMAGAAALLLLTIGIYHLTPPVSVGPEVDVVAGSGPPPSSTEASRVVLDPVTVGFFEQSELLLRSFMKIEPADIEDVDDAKKIAVEQLIDIDQRKQAAAEVPRVVNVMETYETVLRDIRNLNGQTMAEDISDLQTRIEKNGLIANMKAFQPAVVLVNFNR